MTSAWKEETVPLAYPIKVGELSLTEIVLREPDVDGMEAIEKLGFGSEPLLDANGSQMTDPSGLPLFKPPTVAQLRGAIVVLSGQKAETIGKLHREDFMALGEKAVPLLVGLEESPIEPGSKDATDTTSLQPTSPTS